MKNTIIALILFVCTNIEAQSYVNIENIYLKNNSLMSNGTWITSSMLKTILGVPVSEQNSYSEIDEKNIRTLTYSNSNYDFIDDGLVSFEMNNNSILRINNISIIVGQTTDSEINYYFQNFKKSGFIFNRNTEYYQIPLAINNITIDYYLFIEISTSSTSDKKISKITLWYP